jgi:hypothetical protein
MCDAVNGSCGGASKDARRSSEPDRRIAPAYKFSSGILVTGRICVVVAREAQYKPLLSFTSSFKIRVHRTCAWISAGYVSGRPVHRDARRPSQAAPACAPWPWQLRGRAPDWHGDCPLVGAGRPCVRLGQRFASQRRPASIADASAVFRTGLRRWRGLSPPCGLARLGCGPAPITSRYLVAE